MPNTRRLLLLIVFLNLAACGSPYRVGKPAPVVSRGDAVDTRTARTSSDKPVEVQPYQPPQQVALARPAPASRAVRNLMQRAQAQREAGDYPAAQVSVERALRIEPGNAHLWNRLARLHLLQQAYARAEQFASKSNSLNPGDDILKADNWSVIAQARQAQGNNAGARKASARALR